MPRTFRETSMLLTLTASALAVTLAAPAAAGVVELAQGGPAAAAVVEAAPNTVPAQLPLTSQPALAPAGRPAGGATATPDALNADILAGLKLRSLGPALTSGRISDFAVDPHNRAHYFVASSSGGVWKTINGGTTWTPVFDDQGAYSIGCVALDPRNPHVVWVGTGENNSQRSVGFGDGVYRSRDGGAHWENVGLKESEHIGRIAIHPQNSNIVYVAAQGPLWRSGGDRGLYKTADGGAKWERVLYVSDDTGVNEVHLDPRDPNTLYATAYQRRRHVWTLINGGPESAIHKSTDGGATWRKVNTGLPEVDLGRIGLAIAPANPDVVYAIVEAAAGAGGFYRSTNRGETWEKRSDYKPASPQYYNEIVADPTLVDRVYVLDTVLHVSEDGGKTWQSMLREDRHVDDHALWIDPQDNNYLLMGCDGGAYESFDRGAYWRFMANLPVTQFYRITADNALPFYNVYGGTQDNSSLGAPSRTRERMGIANEHWFVTVGGDGYKSQVDPEDPNIVYSLWQYGGLVRHDRRSGEITDIKPREAPGEEPLRWNWDTPLILSPHDHRRVYVAAQRVFRSDDQGQSWTAVSPDLTRRIDRDQLKVMGRIQPADAVAKHESTSFYGNIVALAESPRQAGLLYVGTDDGLVQVTANGGQSWRKIDLFPTVPERTYVSCLTPSRHATGRAYAAFENHKMGDFAPYLLRSDDEGETWTSIVGNLPARNFVWTVVEDHIDPDLLFAGTEFGLYVTVDGGQKWTRLKGGLPTIAVKDLVIQQRENDLVVGTFGRGIYILDDYTPLRQIRGAALAQAATIFPVKPALRYVPSSRLGDASGRGAQGASFYAAPNPPFGAVFTWYLKDKLTTRREQRQEAEKKAAKEGRVLPLPTMEQLRAEDEEKEPSLVLIVADEEGETVCRIAATREAGIQRANWDLRYPAAVPTDLRPPEQRMPWEEPPRGPLALPGTYSVTLARQVDGVLTPLAGPQSFEVVPLELSTFPTADRAEVLAFQQKIARLQRAVRGAIRAAEETENRLAHLRRAFLDTPLADPALLAETQRLQQRLTDLLTDMRGDATLAKRNAPAPPAVIERVENIVGSQWYSTSPPTQTQRDEYRHAGTQFGALLEELRKLIREDLPRLEQKLEAADAPWTPGRLPEWKGP